MIPILIKRRNKNKSTKQETETKKVQLPIDDSGGLGVPQELAKVTNIPDPIIYENSPTYSEYRRIVPATDIVLITSLMSGIILFVTVYYMPQVGILMSILGSVIFLPIGFGIAMLLLSNFRIKLLRKITKKNLGFAKFIFGGQIIKPVIADLDKDTIKFEEGIYLTEKGEIRKSTSESVAGDKTITKQKVFFEEGIPTIYFDTDDLLPVEWSKKKIEDEKPDKHRFRSPKHISATLNKEIAVEKAKTMKAFKSRENIMVIVILVVSIISIYLIWQIYSKQGKIEELATSIIGMKDIITELVRQTIPQNSTSPVIPVVI